MAHLRQLSSTLVSAQQPLYVVEDADAIDTKNLINPSHGKMSNFLSSFYPLLSVKGFHGSVPVETDTSPYSSFFNDRRCYAVKGRDKNGSKTV